VNMFIAGGDNMRFLFYHEHRNLTGQIRWVEATAQTYAGTPVAQGTPETNVIDQIFMESFPPIIEATGRIFDKVTNSDEVQDVLSLLHRYQIYENVNIPAHVWHAVDPTLLVGAVGAGPDYPFQLWRSYFLFYRGTFNYKLVRANDVANLDGTITVVTGEKYLGVAIDPTFLQTPFYGRSGTIVEDTTLKPSVEFHVPYYGKYPIVPGLPWVGGQYTDCVYENLCYFYWDPRPNASTGIQLRVMFSIADDFSFGWGCGVPITWSQRT